MASSKKKAMPFQKAHVLDFAFEVVEVVSTNARGDVTVQCLFCMYEGRDVVKVGVVGRKPKQRSDIQYFTKPFAPFKYRSHHKGQHAASWIEYQALSIDHKKDYFNGRIKATNTLHHHFDLDKDTYEFSICTDIVEVIIGEVFFRDDEQFEDIVDNDGEQNPADAARRKLIKKHNEKNNAMKLFCKEDDALVYTAIIKDVLCFNLAMDYVGMGLSFRQTAVAIQKVKTRTKRVKLTGLNDSIVSQYTRILVDVALQQIAVILDDESIWAMLLAGDNNTHRGQSFFQLRVCVCYRNKLVNLHLVAMPMFKCHSAKNIFNLIAKFMDTLYSVVVKAAAEGIDNCVWCKKAYMFSVYLRAQDNLIITMNINLRLPTRVGQLHHHDERQVPKEDESMGALGLPVQLLHVLSPLAVGIHQGQSARPDAVGPVVDHHVCDGVGDRLNQRHVGPVAGHVAVDRLVAGHVAVDRLAGNSCAEPARYDHCHVRHRVWRY
jgi:hypothetical protein